MAGDSPREIETAYASVTGTVPMMPEYGLGFWQCKLRYQTQEELLSVAREYKRRGLPLDLIVIDFFHWPKQGEWKFDPTYWPDPKAMVAELQQLGVELMVSIWPTVDRTSENFAEMWEKGYLVRCDRGMQRNQDFMGETLFYDATNPEARAFVWGKAKANYYDPAFRELFVRWFQWGAFLPVMRLHGDREPKQPQVGTTGGAACCSGGPNEVWSFGEEVYGICQKYLQRREQLRDYTRTLMAAAHEHGEPVMRTLFYEFPDDPACWEVEDQYCYGPDYLVAPILEAGQRLRRVYLPRGAAWTNLDTGETFSGGQWIDAPAPLDTMPVFTRG